MFFQSFSSRPNFFQTNQNQNQNQNQGWGQNQNRNQRNPNQKKAFFAIGPANENDKKAISGCISLKYDISFFGNFAPKLTYQDCFGYNYYSLEIDQNLKSRIPVGRFKYLNQNFYISPYIPFFEKLCIDFVDYIFSRYYSDRYLDLSNLQQKSSPSQPGREGSIQIDFESNPDLMPFILFLCRLKSIALALEITEINFDDNLVQNPNDLKAFLFFIPYLRDISMINCSTSQNNWNNFKYNIGHLKNHGLSIVDKAHNSGYAFSSRKKSKNVIYNPPFTSEMNDFTNIGQNNLEMAAPSEIDYSLLPNQVNLNPYDFPTNSFLQGFIVGSSVDLMSLVQFYDPMSIFSITSDKFPQNSPLTYYERFSTDRSKMNVYHNWSGPGNIIQAQVQIFGQKLEMIVGCISQRLIHPRSYAVILHGAFRNLMGTFSGFDRSLIIIQGSDESSFQILNDHISIRNLS